MAKKEYKTLNKKIFFSNYDNFIREIENSYIPKQVKITSPDAALDIEHSELFNSGLYSVKKGNTEFQFFYQRKSSDLLYVFLNAGGVRANDELPVFQRINYFHYLNGNCINIADPMHTIYKDKEPLATWYYGTKTESYIHYVAEIVLDISKKLNIATANICFMGSSAGGYVSLFCSSLIKGSVGIAVNPQIKLALSEFSNDFNKKVGIDLSEADELGRNDISDTIIKSSKSKFLITVNVRSEEDIKQMLYLCKKINYIPQFGIQEVNPNIKLWLYDANKKPFHNAIEPNFMFPIMTMVAKSNSIYKDFSVEELNLFNEIWHNEYEYKRRLS